MESRGELPRTLDRSVPTRAKHPIGTDTNRQMTVRAIPGRRGAAQICSRLNVVPWSPSMMST
jgi:hypothetical protein